WIELSGQSLLRKLYRLCVHDRAYPLMPYVMLSMCPLLSLQIDARTLSTAVYPFAYLSLALPYLLVHILVSCRMTSVYKFVILCTFNYRLTCEQLSSGILYGYNRLFLSSIT